MTSSKTERCRRQNNHAWLSYNTAEAANESVRFQLLDEDQLAKFVASLDSENTKK